MWRVWRLLREVSLGMVRADGGMALGHLDPQVITIIQQHQQSCEGRG
jgi:hypothetical protein